MDTPCESFSGGERARLALALIVWQRPNVLILDEPTNHFGPRYAPCIKVWLYKILRVQWFLVSHERQLIASVCDDLVLVHAGKCTEFEGDLQVMRNGCVKRANSINSQNAVQQQTVASQNTAAKVDKSST